MRNLIDYIYGVERDVVSYGTADFAMYAYGLIKMIKPANVVEFGTGLGVTAFMAAQACKDNDFGHVTSIDDGCQNVGIVEDYFGTLDKKVSEFGLGDHITLLNKRLSSAEDIVDAVGGLDDVGFVFNDFNSDPMVLSAIISWLSSRVKSECYFFTDRGYTYEPNRIATEQVVKEINESLSPLKASCLFVKKQTLSDQDSFSLIKLEITR